MYEGDRLSKKETSLLPKSISIECGDTSQGFLSTTIGHTEVNSSLIRIPAQTKHEPLNIPGTLRANAYPTTILLKTSQQSRAVSFAPSSDAIRSDSDRCVSDRDRLLADVNDGCSDYSELRS